MTNEEMIEGTYGDYEELVYTAQELRARAERIEIFPVAHDRLMIISDALMSEASRLFDELHQAGYVPAQARSLTREQYSVVESTGSKSVPVPMSGNYPSYAEASRAARRVLSGLKAE